MNFLELAQQRYTTKKYNPTQKITNEEIETLKQILQLSPSSINSQPWHFTFVADQEQKSKLAAVSYFNEERINQASHLVVFSVIDDIALFEKQIEQNLPQGAINYYKQFMQPQAERNIKSWLQHQVYLSLGFFLSACAAMHIDSTPMEGILGAEYDNLLADADYTALFAVAIGYRDPEDSNQLHLRPKSRLPLEDVVKEFKIS